MEKKNPIATITIDGNITPIVIELLPEHAPNTVNNFISLVKNGFYNGLIFHRVIKGFMIQGGCPQGKGIGNAGYSIKGEFNANGVTNTLSHSRGVISMARASQPNSASSQFFIMHDAATYLDGNYAGFGKVVSGMEVVDKIADTQTDYTDKPLIPQKIKSIEVDCFGVEYKEPNKI